MTKKLKAMREGGRKLGMIRDKVLGKAREGVSTAQLNRIGERLIKKEGGELSFKKVNGYEWGSCVCVNDGIVHCVPNEYRLKKGDLVTLDIGFYYKGYHTDTAATIIVGEEDNKFLKTGKKALKNAIAAAKAGNRIGDISHNMQKVVESAGYNVARTLVGHGVGKKLHEEPQIPCWIDEEDIEKTPRLKEGMTLAVEVIYMEGNYALKMDLNDRWTIRTKDGSLSAMFEHTIAITQNSPLILTK